MDAKLGRTCDTKMIPPHPVRGAYSIHYVIVTNTK